MRPGRTALIALLFSFIVMLFSINTIHMPLSNLPEGKPEISRDAGNAAASLKRGSKPDVSAGIAKTTGSSGTEIKMAFSAEIAGSSIKSGSPETVPETVKEQSQQPEVLVSRDRTLAMSRSDSKTDYLRIGSQGNAVLQLQKKLKVLGLFDAGPTGYYGEITAAAVKEFQRQNGLKQSGITGEATLSKLDALYKKAMSKTVQGKALTVEKSKTTEKAAAQVSASNAELTAAAETKKSKTASSERTTVKAARSGDSVKDYMIPWFGGVEDIFSIGRTATVYDIESGKSFDIMRTYGYNHADCEPLTAEDTAIMKNIYGGQWSWDRRAVIVKFDGRRIAASMAGMPHAGIDDASANATVNGRSGGYGTGDNLDKVKNNDMDGHFDLHFLGSRTHGTNSVNEAHQEMVRKAAAWAAKKY